MTSTAKPIPDGASVVIPRLFCRDVAAAMDFCKNTFSAVERVRRPGPDGTVAHALMTIGPAKVLIPVANQFWGDRIGWVMDPSGHVWTIATRVEETSEDQRRERWSTISAKS